MLSQSSAFSPFPDSVKTDTNTPLKPKYKKFTMKKSPWLAVLQSAIIPGLGQIYNESYWKAPLILGLTAYLSYQLYNNNKKYLDYRDQYFNSQNVFPPEGDLNLKTLREFYRDQRDEFIWYLTIVYVINLIDAYVDAHLFDFDVREEKMMGIGKIDKVYRMNFKVNF